MQAIPIQDWQAIPEQAQREVYDFFLYLKQKHQPEQQLDHSETLAFSNHSANLINDWKNNEEDQIWT